MTVHLTRCAALVVILARAGLAEPMPDYLTSAEPYAVDFMIGGELDDEASYLYQPRDLAIDADGNLFVLDTKGYCIKKFDPTGEYLATFGRQGEGPGEMERAYSMSLDPEGNVVIYDTQQRRFTTFGPDGTPTETVGLYELGRRSIRDFEIGPRGSVYVVTRWQDWVELSRPALFVLERLDLDTLEETPIDSTRATDMYVVRDGNTTWSVSAPFPHHLRWGVAPSGKVVTCDSGDYVIEIYSPELRLLSTRRHDVDPDPVTDADLEQYLETYEEGRWRDMARDADVPEFKPYFEHMHIDDGGYLLFQRSGDDSDVATYDVFDPDGVFLDQVELPSLGGDAIITQDRILDIGVDEDESPVVYCYRRP